MEADVKCAFFHEDVKTNRKRLFEEALFLARHGKVLYILSEELNELPELSQDLNSVSRHYMKMISFLYAKSLESLIESISTLPDWQNVPSTIILDGLNDYCSKKNIQNACGVVGMLIDTAQSCSVTLKRPCRLFVSITREAVSEDYCNTLKELYCTTLL